MKCDECNRDFHVLDLENLSYDISGYSLMICGDCTPEVAERQFRLYDSQRKKEGSLKVRYFEGE